MTIARTETHRAANTTQFRRCRMGINTANLEIKSEWITTNDGACVITIDTLTDKSDNGTRRFNVGGRCYTIPYDPRTDAKIR